MLLSLFCGPGGLDLGFERAGFRTSFAFDKHADSIRTYNHNRLGADSPAGYILDLTDVSAKDLDVFAGRELTPTGVIGGPPCQSFSQANRSPRAEDPRHILPLRYAALLAELNARHRIDFFMFENVPGLGLPPHDERFRSLLTALTEAGFNVSSAILNAMDFGVPQRRKRLIVVGFNAAAYPGKKWTAPTHLRQESKIRTVRDTFVDLPEPTYFHRGASPETIQPHPNHWCMAPKSKKFTDGTLKEGNTCLRSFKTLAWDAPSITVAYGNREVHVHPNCQRRLSVYEAMLLQGFPATYELTGNLSSQIRQVSDAVPPPLAEAVALSIAEQLKLNSDTVQASP
ncbi:DNA cytosine methyltransferase [uncultured Thiodictyon sp.]|uniref:DNA cytosine methyltransferase n=1 Tax=uncultured Thiodictyon sp. TaxID=1846217 RepID=UPI0025F82303|nr:DNA cytosine methyltransferase [uncultured Thiodictyon sp.]